jgi:hypothetical protein
MKKVASGAIVALKEALTYLYWYKSDLRSFLTSCLADARILATLDWGDYKRNIVTNLVDRLDRRQDMFQADLLRLMSEVARVLETFRTFSVLRMAKRRLSVRKARLLPFVNGFLATRQLLMNNSALRKGGARLIKTLWLRPQFRVRREGQERGLP